MLLLQDSPNACSLWCFITVLLTLMLFLSLFPVFASSIWAAVSCYEKKEMRLDSFSPCCMSHEQHRVEHSTCSLNLFQLVSYHASVTLFTHNYILALLCFSFNFPALVSASSRFSQRKSWEALQDLKATLQQHFGPIKAHKSRTMWNFLSSSHQIQSVNSSALLIYWFLSHPHLAPPAASAFVH